LREPAIADIVECALLHGVGDRYELFAWVIMPNHVHVLIRQPDGGRLSDIIHGWKPWTAKEVNRHRDGSGTIWQREYFDRYMRNERQFAATVFYIEENPVKAGLAASAAEWRFGSAWWRENKLSTASSL
jgi:REP element-mobilizing transposase RayT